MTEIPKDFPWRAGMLMVDVTGSLAPVRCVAANEGVRVYGRAVLFRPARDAEDSLDWPEWAPDLNDPATVGALAEAVREAFNLPDLETYRGDGGYFIADFAPKNEPEPYQDWPTLRADGTFGVNNKAEVSGVTRGEAWLAAWNARPVPK